MQDANESVNYLGRGIAWLAGGGVVANIPWLFDRGPSLIAAIASLVMAITGLVTTLRGLVDWYDKRQQRLALAKSTTPCETCQRAVVKEITEPR